MLLQRLGSLDENEKQKLRNSLLEYCKLDTLAMVKILEKLKGSKMINYKKRLTLHREFYPLDNIDISVESDRGRIFSSAAFRRLQKRTQVFALELNASIRSRLTHSLEVAQNARYIARTILQKLKKDGLETYGLEDIENAFISTSEMTSLLHDIGNPPFGHFAEETINKWLKIMLYKN